MQFFFMVFNAVYVKRGRRGWGGILYCQCACIYRKKNGTHNFNTPSTVLKQPSIHILYLATYIYNNLSKIYRSSNHPTQQFVSFSKINDLTVQKQAVKHKSSRNIYIYTSMKRMNAGSVLIPPLSAS